MGAVLFGMVAGLALVGGVGVIASRRPVYSALSLLVVLGSLAVDYLLLDAPFIAALQVIIYAGAIVVLFVFIIMLLHAQSGEDPEVRAVLPAPLGVVLCAAFGLVVLVTVTRAADPFAPVGARFGTVEEIGRALFSDFLLPFEAASVVLLIGMIGAVALGKRLPSEAAPRTGPSPIAGGPPMPPIRGAGGGAGTPAGGER